MKRWFNKLSLREKWMVSAAAVIVAVFAFYFLLLTPMNAGLNRLTGQVPYNQSLIVWMQRANGEIRQLPQASAKKQPLSLAAIQTALQTQGVDQRAVLLQQTDADHFVLTIHQASFDKLITAIIALQKTSTFTIEQLELKQVESGVVAGRFALSDN
jgi:general secretion pathway protein M